VQKTTKNKLFKKGIAKKSIFCSLERIKKVEPKRSQKRNQREMLKEMKKLETKIPKVEIKIPISKRGGFLLIISLKIEIETKINRKRKEIPARIPLVVNKSKMVEAPFENLIPQAIV